VQAPAALGDYTCGVKTCRTSKAKSVGVPSRGRARSKTLLAIGGLATLAAALWWRKNPSACPYGQRFWVQAPHPLITRKRLARILELRSGERVLEVGPGAGYYTLEVARLIRPGGRLDVLDVQQEMVDHTLRQSAQRGLDNVEGARGDARSMPYRDATFDAAYLVTVLGEIPDQPSALRELRRVLKPGGRLVVGELFGDPHMVTFGKLRERAGVAGFRFERRVGGPLGYFARFAA
jgi:SAM-dependent methyltransferase